jgi:hypothetical protein
VILNGWVAEVKLNQAVVAVPTLVSKGIVIGAVLVEIEPVEPVAVGRLFATLQDIPKGPEISPDVMEYPVQDKTNVLLVENGTEV